MKKLLILSAMCLAMTAQATVLRVSNVTNSGAPYTTIPAAVLAAAEGDTVMVDGSPTSYGSVTISKRIVLMGPGYLRITNGILAEGGSEATLTGLTIGTDAAGSIIQGMNLTKNDLQAVNINAPNVVITRCMIQYNVVIATAATNVVIHQNYFTDGCIYGSSNDASRAVGTQVTNNIIATANYQSYGIVRSISNGYIAYNTFTRYENSGASWPVNFGRLSSCTLEHNIFVGEPITISSCSIQDNYWSGRVDASFYPQSGTDLDVKNVSLTDEQTAAIEGMGAFAGDDPYVISGIPAGPYISDIDVPASVEKGQILKVNVKLGVQQ